MNIGDSASGFTELDSKFLGHVESIGDDVAVHLAETLDGCEEQQRARHVERAAMIYESLAKMHRILWKTVDLIHGGRTEDVGD